MDAFDYSKELVLTEGTRRRYHFRTMSTCSIIHRRLKKRPLKNKQHHHVEIIYIKRSFMRAHIVCPTSKHSVWRNPPEVSSSPQLQPDFGHYNLGPNLCFPDTVRTQQRQPKVRCRTCSSGNNGDQQNVKYSCQMLNEFDQMSIRLWLTLWYISVE